MAFHLHIVGLGVAHSAQLSVAAQQALDGAACVMGSLRQLAVVKTVLNGQHTEPLPALDQLPALIDQWQQKDVVVAILASGDPLYYGIGRWFGRRFDAQTLSFYPAVSSIQAACHQLGLSLQDVTVLSLHGRPVEKIRRVLKQQQTLVILTDQHSTPQVLAQECLAAGFEQSTLWVCENLGYPQQQLREFSAQDLAKDPLDVDPLHVTVIKIAGRGGVLPEFPGIPDTHFVTDAGSGKGMLTKREVRLGILSLLAPAKGDVAWDIGAGCGGVTVEWAYWNDVGQVYSIEHHPERLQCLQANVARFGVSSNVNIVEGHAPDVLSTLPSANKVFIGGSEGKLVTLLAYCWQQLTPRGVLVASAVTETTKQALMDFYHQRQQDGTATVETVQIAVSRGDQLAGHLLYRPHLPVTLFKFTKEAVDEY